MGKLNVAGIEKAIKLLKKYKVREPYKIYISKYRKNLCKLLDNLGCGKEIVGTTVIYNVEKILRAF